MLQCTKLVHYCGVHLFCYFVFFETYNLGGLQLGPNPCQEQMEGRSPSCINTTSPYTSKQVEVPRHAIVTTKRKRQSWFGNELRILEEEAAATGGDGARDARGGDGRAKGHSSPLIVIVSSGMTGRD